MTDQTAKGMLMDLYMPHSAEQRARNNYERAKREAAEARDEYRATCGDLYDLHYSMWFLDDDTYAAAGTYVCRKKAGHKGWHKGKTLEGYREERDWESHTWHHRRDEAEWNDDNPLRRANR